MRLGAAAATSTSSSVRMSHAIAAERPAVAEADVPVGKRSVMCNALPVSRGATTSSTVEAMRGSPTGHHVKSRRPSPT